MLIGIVEPIATPFLVILTLYCNFPTQVLLTSIESVKFKFCGFNVLTILICLLTLTDFSNLPLSMLHCSLYNNVPNGKLSTVSGMFVGRYTLNGRL